MEKSKKTPAPLLRARALKIKAALSSRSSAANSSLLWAYSEGALEAAKKAQSKGANRNARRRRSALDLAVASNAIELVHELLGCGASIQRSGALHCARFHQPANHPRVGESGHDPNALDPNLSDGYECHAPLGRALIGAITQAPKHAHAAAAIWL